MEWQIRQLKTFYSVFCKPPDCTYLCESTFLTRLADCFYYLYGRSQAHDLIVFENEASQAVPSRSFRGQFRALSFGGIISVLCWWLIDRRYYGRGTRQERIQFNGPKCRKGLHYVETRYSKVFEDADYEFEFKIPKFKTADQNAKSDLIRMKLGT